MNTTVNVIRKSEFTSKNNKPCYLLDLVDLENKRVYKAFTAKKHYENLLEGNVYTGYIVFGNGYTNFYLPKESITE